MDNIYKNCPERGVNNGYLIRGGRIGEMNMNTKDEINFYMRLNDLNNEYELKDFLMTNSIKINKHKWDKILDNLCFPKYCFPNKTQKENMNEFQNPLTRKNLKCNNNLIEHYRCTY